MPLTNKPNLSDDTGRKIEDSMYRLSARQSNQDAPKLRNAQSVGILLDLKKDGQTKWRRYTPMTKKQFSEDIKLTTKLTLM
ncbi:MAG: hypothetical protein NPIRA05_09360 [Nitrospirales bacterium]|nr:MAG: hypothetical protein NPIRA05_09360 [Nitrospirales bacterium]